MRSGPRGAGFALVFKFLARIALSAALILSGAGNAFAQEQRRTLDIVRERGHLICAASQPLPGFAQQNAEGLWSGFDVDFCRAVAAAIFGDPNQVRFRPLPGESRFAQLQVGDVDLIVRNAPWTLQRDIAYGADYVATSFYDGQAFMVPQSLGVVSAYELTNVSVCVVSSGETLRTLDEFFFENQADFTEVLYEDLADLAVAYTAGRCNAISAPASRLFAIRRGLSDPTQHRILPERISKEPLGLVVRQGDDEWFNIIKWTLFAMINAEELGVTQLNLESMQSVRTAPIRRLIGLENDYGAGLRLSPDWMANVIAAAGNYGELYTRNFGPQTGAALLRGPNSLWTEGGLLYAPPIR